MEKSCQECLNYEINMQCVCKIKNNLVPIFKDTNWTAGLIFMKLFIFIIYSLF